MEKFLLNGEWRITSKSYDLVGTVPGSVYSNLLAQGLIEDPFYRGNEATAMDIMDEEFVFTKEFEYEKTSDKILLVCEGIDTLCDLYVNGKYLAHVENMHRSYYLDVTALLKDGKNEIKAVFPPLDAYIKAKKAEKELISGSDCTMAGFSYVRKASYMYGWDWGPRMPDAGIWRNVYLLEKDSARLTDVELLQRHENCKVFVLPKVETDSPAEIAVTVTVRA